MALDANQLSTLQLLLLVPVFVVAVLGNGAILFLFTFYRRFRTIPNILVVNLAVVDMLNALLNMPLFAAWYIHRAHVFHGRLLSYGVISLHNFLVILNVLSLVLLTADRYAAISHGLKYKVWKSKQKAYKATFVTWLLGSLLLTALALYRNRALAKYELDDLHTIEIRHILIKQAGWVAAMLVYGVPFTAIAVMSLLTIRSIRKKNLRIKHILSAGNASQQGRLAYDRTRVRQLRTVKTVALVVGAYLLCCIPAFIHGSLSELHPWLEFCAYYFTHVTSASNPILYALRVGHFRIFIVHKLRAALFRGSYQVRQPSIPNSPQALQLVAEKHRTAPPKALVPGTSAIHSHSSTSSPVSGRNT